MNLFTLVASLGLDDSEYRKGIQDATNSGKNFANGVASSVKAGTIALGNLMSDAAKGAINFVADMGKQSVSIAAELEAREAQFNAAFGDMAGQALAAFQAVGEETNILTSRLQEVGTKGFSQLKGAGLDANTAMEASTKLLELSADAAAYYDISLEEANEKLRSFMRGNTEAGDAIGLFTSESQRNSEALEAYGKKWNDLTEAQKQTLMLNIAEEIYNQSGAIGQAAREGESWGNVTENLSAAWEKVLGTIGGPIKDTLIPVIGEFTTFLENNQEAAKGSAEKVGEFAGALMDKLVVGFQWCLDNGDKVESIITVIGVALGVAFVAANPLGAAITAIATAGVLLITNWEEIETKASAIWENVKSSVTGFVDDVKVYFDGITWDQLGKDIIQGLVEGLKASYETWIEPIQNVFTNIWTGVKNVLGIHSPSTLAAEAGGFIVEGFANGVETGKTTFGEKIKGVFTSIWDGIKSVFGFGGGKSAKEAESDAGEMGMSVVEGLATGLGGEDNSAVAQATSLGERVIEALRTALDITENVSNLGVTIGGAVTAGVDQGAQEAEILGMNTVAMNVFSGLVSAMSITGGIAGYFTSIGAAISQGIAKGIRDSTSSITSAAVEAARAAYNAAKKELGIKSPSRVMMEVGKNYAEGFAMGITQNAGLVANAARNTAQQAVYGSYMGDMNITQNITAVPMSPNELAMQTANALQLLRFA